MADCSAQLEMSHLLLEVRLPRTGQGGATN
jgi:hypothetical protein